MGAARSEKLKPFWLSLPNDDLSQLSRLSDALLSYDTSATYREAVTRALDIADCQVVPFFGAFLRDLRSIFSGMPSIVVIPRDDCQLQLEVRACHIFCLRFVLSLAPVSHERLTL